MIVNNKSCSSVNISWTPEDNRTADFVIFYKSKVHTGTGNYRQNTSPPYTTKLTNLVAETEYIITVTAKYSDKTRTNITAVNTTSGTPSSKGMS